jgi:hypothetical protein
MAASDNEKQDEPGRRPKPRPKTKPPKGASGKKPVSPGDASGFTDMSEYLFVEPASGRQVTVTVATSPIDEAQLFEAVWAHVSAAANLLGADELSLGAPQRTSDGRTFLKASFVVDASPGRRRESIGITLLPQKTCVCVQMVSDAADQDADAELTALLESVEAAVRKGTLMAAPKSEHAATTSHRIGPVMVELPADFAMIGPYQFVTEDGQTRFEVDFRKASAGPQILGTQPVIGSRSQFKPIQEVRRFLRETIRYEVPDFEPIANLPGAVAFGTRATGAEERANDFAGDRPLIDRNVSIDGRSAVVRVYSDEASATTDAGIRLDEFLRELR